MSHIKRWLSAILTLLLTAFFVLPIPVTAVDDTVLPDITPTYLDILDPDIWTGGEGILRISKRNASGQNVLFVTADATVNDTMFITASFSSPLDLSMYRELGLEFMVGGQTECDLEVTFYSGSDSDAQSCLIPAGGSQTVYVRVPEEIAESITALSLSLKGTEQTVSRYTLLSISGDTGFAYSYIERFMCTGFSRVSGTLRQQEDRLSIVPDNGSVAFRMNLAETDLKNGAAICLRINSPMSMGSVSVQAALHDEPVLVTSALGLYAGEHTYTFLVKSVYDTVTVLFEGLSTGARGTLQLTGAAVYPEEFSVETPGSVTSCKYDGKNVIVSGTLSTDTAVNYLKNGELALYAVPLWTDIETALEEEPAAVMSISTRFSLSCVPTEVYTLCRYLVVIRDGEKTIPITPAVFANSGGSAFSSDVSVTALHGADNAGVFESNASSVFLDVYADKLLETENVSTGLLHTYGSSYYYFNRAYVQAFDNEIQFYQAAGTKVYLRLFSGADESFSYHAADQGSIAQLGAITTFLAERYSGIAGLVMGSALDQAFWNAPEDAAKLIAVFSETVKQHLPGAAVILPLGLMNTQRAQGAPTPSDPDLFIARVSYELRQYNVGNVAVLYECGSESSGAVGSTVHLASQVTACGHGCDGGLILWKPQEEVGRDLCGEYQSFSAEAAKAGLRCVVFSVDRISNSGALFDGLKTVMSQNTTAEIAQFTAQTQADVIYKGTYSLWDFTNAYDTGDWVCGGGFDRIISSYAENEPGRVLHTALPGNKQEAGILICWLKNALDLSYGATIELELTLNGVQTQEPELSVIFGSGDSRAEFSANAEFNHPFVISCDLTEFTAASSIDYIAVILRATDDVSLEMSSVTLCSNKKTTAELGELLTKQTNAITQTAPVFYVTVILIVAMTVVIFSMLERRHPEQRKIRKKGRREHRWTNARWK